MKTVIEMAREAGFMMENSAAIQAAERFAELVCADEREACAQFLESTNLAGLPEDTALHYARLLKGFAEGIRARSNTSPPAQRTWVGLTDDELLDIADMAYANDLELLHNLQAKLKELNT